MESECEIMYPQQFVSTVEEPQTVLGGSGISENCKKPLNDSRGTREESSYGFKQEQLKCFLVPSFPIELR